MLSNLQYARCVMRVQRPSSEPNAPGMSHAIGRMQGQPCCQGSAASLVLFATPRVKHLETFEFEFNFSNLGARDPRARHAGDRLSQNHRYSSIQNCVGVSGST